MSLPKIQPWPRRCASLAVACALAGCGKSEVASAPAPPGEAQPATGSTEPPQRPAVSGQLSKYLAVDLGEQIDAKGWEAYRETFARTLAAVPGIDDRALGQSAFGDVGRERDSFKREDLLKGKGEALKALRASAAPKIHLLWGSKIRGNTPYASVHPYDQQTQSYRIQLDNLSGHLVGRGWTEQGSASSDSLGYRVNLVGILDSSRYQTEFIVKMPADRARAVEAQLAPLRPNGTSHASLPVSVYGTVVGSREPSWTRATVEIDADAIGLHLPNAPMGAPTLIIDGPEIKAQ